MPELPARTAINQNPHGGRAYPFVDHGVLSEAILDFYLSYEDDACAVALPISLSLVAGFTVTLRDANSLVLAALTEAEAATTSWGDSRVVYQWQTANQVVRLVVRTANLAAAYDQEGVLDPRTCNRLAARVQGLRLGLQTFAADIVLEDGFNIAMSRVDSNRVDGGLRTTRLVMTARPGDGLGRAPGCEEAEILVRRINGMAPDPAGNFRIELDECFRAQLPVLISENADQRIASFGDLNLPSDEAKHALILYSDCKPCCECDFFARTYKGLKRIHGFWADTVSDAEGVRDQLQRNKDRWEANLECRKTRPARLTVMPESRGRVSVGAVYCNSTGCCMQPVELWFTYQVFDGNGDPVDAMADVLDGVIAGSDGDVPYAVGGTWPILKAYLDYLDQSDNAKIAYRIRVHDPVLGWSLRVTLTIHAPEPEGCSMPEAVVPADILTLWEDQGVTPAYEARSITQRTVPLDPLAGSSGGGGSGGGGTDIDSVTETPVGAINGSNRDFVLSEIPLAGSVLVFLNGLCQSQPNDYTQNGVDIQFTAESTPQTGDLLTVHYLTRS